MRLVAALAIILAAQVARADKTFTSEKSATWDCSKDGSVTITHGNGKYTFKGTCKDITINGGHNTLAVEGVTTLTINGASNAITADSVTRSRSPAPTTRSAGRNPAVPAASRR